MALMTLASCARPLLQRPCLLLLVLAALAAPLATAAPLGGQDMLLYPPQVFGSPTLPAGNHSTNATEGRRAIDTINYSCINVASTMTALRLVTNGWVMKNTVKVYNIWVGAWTPAERQVVDYFVDHFDTTAWFHTTSAGYHGSDRAYTSDNVVLAGSYLLPSGSYQTLTDTINTIKAAASKFGFPIDPNGVYLVMPSREIAVSTAVLNNACGWHSAFGGIATATGASVPVQFGMVFDRDACRVQMAYPQGPATLRAQVLVSAVAHEIVEAMTDPNGGSGWKNPLTGYENADQCSYCFGTVTRDNTGAAFNQVVGPSQLRYLVQQNYDTRQGKCVSSSLRNTNVVQCGTTQTTETCPFGSCKTANSQCVAGVCRCVANACFVGGTCRLFPAPAQACAAPVLGAGVVLSPAQATYAVRTTVSVRCSTGQMPTASSMTCMSNGLWDKTVACTGAVSVPSPTVASPTVASTTGGWKLGAAGQSCSAVCGASCNAASATAIRSAATFEVIRKKLGGPACSQYLASTYAQDPSFYSAGICYYSSGSSTCAAADPNTRRICCTLLMPVGWAVFTLACSCLTFLFAVAFSLLSLC